MWELIWAKFFYPFDPPTLNSFAHFLLKEQFLKVLPFFTATL